MISVKFFSTFYTKSRNINSKKEHNFEKPRELTNKQTKEPTRKGDGNFCKRKIQTSEKYCQSFICFGLKIKEGKRTLVSPNESESNKYTATMGGCASKDKNTQVENDDGAGGIEGCVSNSMIFLQR